MEREQSTLLAAERKRGAHLKLDERGAIEALRKEGMSLRAIAQRLGCAHATVWNELKRGTPPKTGPRGPMPRYKARVGQKAYEEHRSRCHRAYKVSDCQDFVTWMIGHFRKEQWSLDVCVGTARQQGLFPNSAIPCAKTLYNAVNAGRLQIKRFDLPEALRRRPQKPRPHRAPKGRSIDTRPDVAAAKTEFGHWEGDTVVGRRGKGEAVVLTLLEKSTRQYLALRVPGRTSAAVMEAFKALREDYGKEYFGQIFKTLTVDNGVEFASLPEIESWGTMVYYAHPYTSSERGQNERRNGLLRRFIPKGQSINQFSADEIFWFADALNAHPWRVLNYRKPDDLFEEQIDKIYALSPRCVITTGHFAKSSYSPATGSLVIFLP